MSLVDRETGEVASIDAVQSAALDYVWLLEERQQTRASLADIDKRIERLAGELLGVMEPGEVIDTGPAKLVRAPASRPAQRVSRSGCEAWQEELLGLGIGHVAYQPPGIAEVRRNAARILAAGIDLERIAPTPAPGPDRLEVVSKEGA